MELTKEEKQLLKEIIGRHLEEIAKMRKLADQPVQAIAAEAAYEAKIRAIMDKL
jgi:hypothetical protein